MRATGNGAAVGGWQCGPFAYFWLGRFWTQHSGDALQGANFISGSALACAPRSGVRGVRLHTNEHMFLTKRLYAVAKGELFTSERAGFGD